MRANDRPIDGRQSVQSVKWFIFHQKSADFGRCQTDDQNLKTVGG